MRGVGTRSSILSPILPDLLELGSTTNIVEGFIMNENGEKKTNRTIVTAQSFARKTSVFELSGIYILNT